MITNCAREVGGVGIRGTVCIVSIHLTRSSEALLGTIWLADLKHTVQATPSGKVQDALWLPAVCGREGHNTRRSVMKPSSWLAAMCCTHNSQSKEFKYIGSECCTQLKNICNFTQFVSVFGLCMWFQKWAWSRVRVGLRVWYTILKLRTLLEIVKPADCNTVYNNLRPSCSSPLASYAPLPNTSWLCPRSSTPWHKLKPPQGFRQWVMQCLVGGAAFDLGSFLSSLFKLVGQSNALVWSLLYVLPWCGHYRMCCLGVVTTVCAALVWSLPYVLPWCGHYCMCCLGVVTTVCAALVWSLLYVLPWCGHYRMCCLGVVTTVCAALVWSLPYVLPWCGHYHMCCLVWSLPYVLPWCGHYHMCCLGVVTTVCLPWCGPYRMSALVWSLPYVCLGVVTTVCAALVWSLPYVLPWCGHYRMCCLGVVTTVCAALVWSLPYVCLGVVTTVCAALVWSLLYVLPYGVVTTVCAALVWSLPYVLPWCGHYRMCCLGVVTIVCAALVWSLPYVLPWCGHYCMCCLGVVTTVCAALVWSLLYVLPWCGHYCMCCLSCMVWPPGRHTSTVAVSSTNIQWLAGSKANHWKIKGMENMQVSETWRWPRLHKLAYCMVHDISWNVSIWEGGELNNLCTVFVPAPYSYLFNGHKLPSAVEQVLLLTYCTVCVQCPPPIVTPLSSNMLHYKSGTVWGHAVSSGLVASLNPIAAIPFARASGKGLL